MDFQCPPSEALGLRSIVYDNDLVAVEFFFKCKVHLNKPIYMYVGFSILELSKVLMYRFFCDTLKPRYGENVRLCYTDTDSFILQYATADQYANMSDMMDQYDTSNYQLIILCTPSQTRKSSAGSRMSWAGAS